MKEVVIKVSGDFPIKVSYRDSTTDFRVIQQVWEEACYDLKRFARYEEIVDSYRRILGRGRVPLIVDAGANIGASTLFFSNVYRGAKTVAIEPEAGNFDVLLSNAKDGGNIDCLNVALSSRDGTLELVDPGHHEWGFRAVSEGGKSDARKICTIPSLSMKTLMERYDDYEPFIAKIDIEGGESDLFSCDTEWVDRFKVVIVELHDWMLPGQGSSASFLRTISKLNRDFVHHGENIFSIRN